jgi:hypothetical protein
VANWAQEEDILMTNDRALREHLFQLLDGGHAHPKFEEIVDEFPVDRAGIRPPGAPHSAWELLEHMRIAQNDILRFSKEPDYVSPEFPGGYWPVSPAPTRRQWRDSVEGFQKDLAQFKELLRDPSKDLHEPFAWGDGQTLLREALLIADHNSYHLGQLMLVRRLLE